MPEDDCQRAIETLQIKFVANYHHKSKIQLLLNIAERGNMTLKDYILPSSRKSYVNVH